MSDAIYIVGHRARTQATTPTPSATDALNDGIYDIYSDVDIFIRVANASSDGDPNASAAGVGSADGYRIFAGEVVSVIVPQNHRIGVVSASPGTMFFHRVG